MTTAKSQQAKLDPPYPHYPLHITPTLWIGSDRGRSSLFSLHMQHITHTSFFSLYWIPHCHKSFSILWIFWGDIHSLLGLLEMIFFMFYSVDLQLTNVSLISVQILLYIVGYLLLLLFFYYLNLHMLIYSLSCLFIWFWWRMDGYWEIM